MTCTKAKTILKESTNYSDKELVCCDSCHEDAEEGYNDYLLFGSEPCCNLIALLTESGLLDP